ncbi:MAG: matrixin family metalloprotease [Oscillospiraceae bacterium]|nr:matrixin family metalloprotease [Oscillospiraceae bacterium]
MKIKQLISLCTALVLSYSAAAFNVSAEVETRIIHPISYNHRLIACMSNLMIYYSPTYANSYGATTMSAANAWANHSNLAFTMNWNRISNMSDATVQCSYFRDSNDDTLAETTFFYSSNSISPTSSNWNMCKIKLNLNYNIPTDTITHEFGHVFGLDENNDDPTSIMCQTRYGRTATRPSNTDIAMLNGLYPNAF